MENDKSNKAKQTLEQAEKVSKALDKGVEWTGEKLETVPSLLGSHKAKIIVGLVVLMGIAIFRDTTLLLMGVLVGVILYSSSLISMAKKAAEKKAASDAAKKAAVLLAKQEAETKTDVQIK